MPMPVLRSCYLSPTMPTMPAMFTPVAKELSLDHLVLTVKDPDASIAFYQHFLGAEHTVFTSKGTERHALLFGNQKINLHVSGIGFEPKARTAQSAPRICAFSLKTMWRRSLRNRSPPESRCLRAEK